MKIQNYLRFVFLLTLVAVFASESASALNFGITGSIRGKVFDRETREELIGVNVVLLNTRLGGTTNKNGIYRIVNIPPGKYTLQYSYIGYKKHVVENVTVNVDEITRLSIELEPGELALEEVLVTGEPLILKQDITGTSHVVNAAQIKLLPIDNMIDIIATQPGVTRDLHIRGGRQSEILYLVDGLPFTEATGGEVGGMIPKSSIQEMKILTGGFDAEYGNAMSGVINIVTRRGTVKKSFSLRSDTDNYFGTPETNNAKTLELSASGPLLSDNLSYFTATDFRTSDTRYGNDFKTSDALLADKYAGHFQGPIIKEFNNITRLDYNLTDNIRLNAQAIVSWKKNHDYEFRWRMNLMGLPQRKKFSYRVSAGISQFLTENIFYELSFSRYSLNTRLGPENREDLDITDLWEYDFLLQFVQSGSRLWWADENQTQYTVKGAITALAEEQRNTKLGFEVTYYDMDISRIKYEPQTSFYGKPLLFLEPLDYSTTYRYKPVSGAVYIQDKIKLQDDGNISMGIRWDFLDPKAQRPSLEWVPTENDDFEKEITEWVPATMKHSISPRFGFSLPITPRDFFISNFGYFFQVPLFEYLYSGLDINLKKKNNILVGNPDMKPMITKAKEFSYRRKLDDDLSFIFTWFDKETENLVDSKTFLASDSKALDDGYYAQYVNSPYANSTGIEMTLEKHSPGLLYGRFSYSMMRAEGVSERRDEEVRYIQWGFEPVNRLYPLSWDQRHTFNAVISSDLPRNYTCDILVNYHSPRPYTYFPSKDGIEAPGTVVEPNNKRMKSNLYLDVKATKVFRIDRWNMRNWDWLFYVDIRNILDKRNVLWIASDGTIGGELHDPGAYDMPRRMKLGIEISFK